MRAFIMSLVALAVITGAAAIGLGTITESSQDAYSVSSTVRR